MTITDIHKAFDDLLEPGVWHKKRLRRKIGLTGSKAAQYRFQNKYGAVSINLKVKWLERAGIKVKSETIYTRADMLQLLHFSRRKDSQRSDETLGDDYLFEKFLLWRQQGCPAVIKTGVIVR